MSASRKQAPRLARPAARYWKGKAPKGVAEVDSDSDAEVEEEEEEVEEGDVLIRDVEADDDDNEAPKAMNFALKVKDIDISRDAIVSREAARLREQQEEESEEESEEDEADVRKDDDESSEEEESSEDEQPKLQFRPVFVPKRSRATIIEKAAEDIEEEKREAEAEERRKQSHDLVAESIRRELLEKEKEGEVPDIDDADGLDPEGEFEAWKLRELGRIKRDKQAEMRREEEREEVERRRALPEAQRMKEDLEHAQKLREEKPKGQQKFLQKYWHKGAFHQDAEILQKHDYTEATASTVDVSMLPKVMQVRNFGKRSRTKYTHLVDQDTTGAPMTKVGTEAGCFTCGGPHLKKDCPQSTGPWTARKDGLTGANGVARDESRQWGGPPRDTGRSWRSGGERESERDHDRDRDRGGWDDRRERSRSPRRRRRSPSRSRSRSNERGSDRRDKRRRVS